MGLDESRRYRETSFGPPSERIRPSDFAKNASDGVKAIAEELAALWKQTRSQTRERVQAELRCVLAIITVV